MSQTRTCAICLAPLSEDAPEGAICSTCSVETSARTVIQKAPATPVLATIGDYEVIDKLGEGGMGAVYRARQTSLGRIVALKVLPEQAQRDEDSVSRFEREAKVAAQLNHPNLVRVYTSGSADGTHFIAMELVEGENLHQRLKRGALPISEALRICADVARALQCGWDTAQLIHRDIKPSNIYLAHDGAVKLGDLGIAKSLLANTTGLTQTGTMMGTPHYISPEQAKAEKNLDFRADIYSLGCTLFHCLTGRTPYHADDPLTLMNQHLTAPPPALLKALPGAPIFLARLVGKMLKKSKHERHASYADLIAEMDYVREQIESGATHAGPSRVAQAWKNVGDGSATPGRITPLNTPPSTPSKRTPAATASKSKLPLYGSVAAAVLVLGLGAWGLLGKKSASPARGTSQTATTSSQPAASSTAPPPSAAKPAAPGSIAARLAGSSPAGWQPLFTDEEWRTPVPGKRNFENGLLHLQADFTKPASSADVAVRACIRLAPRSGAPGLTLRSSQEGSYDFLVGTDRKTAQLSYAKSGNRDRDVLAKFTLPEPVQIGEGYVLELRAQGRHLTALFNGRVVCEADDDRATLPGLYGLKPSGNCWYESAEAQTLSSAISSSGAQTAKPADPAPWQPLVPEAEWKKTVLPGREFVDGLLHLSKRALDVPQPGADSAIRARIHIRDFDGYPEVHLRSTNAGKYLATLYSSSSVDLLFYPSGGGTNQRLGKHTLPQPLRVGDTVTLELRAQGSHLTVLLNDKVVIEAEDSTLTEAGKCGLYASGEAWFESAEVRALPAAATAAGWQPLLPGEVKWRSADGSGFQEFKDGLLHLHNAEPTGVAPSADGAIRARVRFLEGTKNLVLFLRSVGGVGRYLVGFNPTSVELQRNPLSQNDAGRPETLGKFTLPKPLAVGDTLQLELRARGQHLTVLVNGTTAIEADDAQLTAPGRWGAYALDGWLESLEVQTLPATAASPAAAQGDTIDLLPLVDVKRDAVKGTWNVTPDGLALARPADFAALELPYEPPEEYNLDVVFTATNEGRSVNAYLVAGGSSFAWKMNARGQPPPTFGLDLIDRKLMFTRTEGVVEHTLRIVPGERCTTTVEVRRGLLRCSFQGQEILKWSGDFRRLSMEDGNKLRNPRALGIGSFQRAVTFHRVTVREVSGKGKLTAAATTTPASPTLLAPSAVQTFGGHRYQFRPHQGKTWAEAKADAETAGGHLATITSQQEDEWVRKTFCTLLNATADKLWIGAAQEAPGAPWRWVTGEPFTYTSWRPNEPSGARDTDYPLILQYLGYLGAIGWDDFSASYTGKVAGYLVEWDDATSATPTTDAAAYDPAKWVTADPTKLYLTGGATVRGDVVILPNSGGAMPNEGRDLRDGAIRARHRVGDTLSFSLRETPDDRYGAQLTKQHTIRIFVIGADKKAITLQEVPLPARLLPESECVTEFRAVGSLLTVRVNGELLASVEDSRVKEGNARIWNFSGKEAQVHDLAVLVLAAPPGAAAPGASTTPATATKDVPFVNSLGMKFVPVPITGGPTDGQRVLFSIWETRVQDYEAFAKETGREWPKPDFEQGPTHPAINVNWQDATAFCAWLTDRERKAGKIGTGEAYRLPFDREWSCAVGIATAEPPDLEPDSRGSGIPGQFPWGRNWPPPSNAGNYAGEEILGPEAQTGRSYLKNYRDPFPQTAPVGSFPANDFGLFDLGGNVAEFCADLWGKNKPGFRPMRGGTFAGRDNEWELRSGFRFAQREELRVKESGFRVVLAPAP